MSDIRDPQDVEEEAPATEILLDESYGLPDEVVREVEELLAEEKLKKAQKRAEMLHAADLADLLEALNRESRQLLVQLRGVFPRLHEHQRGIALRIIEQPSQRPQLQRLLQLDVALANSSRREFLRLQLDLER